MNCGSEKNRFFFLQNLFPFARGCEYIFWQHLLRASVLGDGFGAFADGVLSKFAGQKQPDCRLDLPTRDRRTFVVVRQAASLGGDAFEDVIDETVHDAHRLARDTGVGVDLLQNLVDIDRVALLPPALLLFVAFRDIFLRFPRFLRGLSARLRWHTVET